MPSRIFSTLSRMQNLTIQERIDAFIKHLDEEMDLVMITERMDESLILLKEYLCWNMTDIIYLKRLVSSEPKDSISEATKARILKYQVIDSQLFDHFNATFERNLDRIGRQKVAEQVIELQKVREAFENKCFNKKKRIVLRNYHSMSWKLTDYGKNKNLACSFLRTDDVKLTNAIAQLQLSRDYTVPIKDAKGNLHNAPFVMQDELSKIQQDYESNEDPV